MQQSKHSKLISVSVRNELPISTPLNPIQQILHIGKYRLRLHVFAHCLHEIFAQQNAKAVRFISWSSKVVR